MAFAYDLPHLLKNASFCRAAKTGRSYAKMADHKPQPDPVAVIDMVWLMIYHLTLLSNNVLVYDLLAFERKRLFLQKDEPSGTS